MGVCVGWTLKNDIAPDAWKNIQQDFDKIAQAYPEHMKQQRRDQKSKAPFLMRLTMGKLPDPIFEINQNSNDRLVVSPGLGRHRLDLITAENQTWSTWQLDRQKGEGWCKTNCKLHDQLLFAALMLVEKHAPGQLIMTQNDYEGDIFGEVAGWVEEKTGMKLGAPEYLHDDVLDEPIRPIPKI